MVAAGLALNQISGQGERRAPKANQRGPARCLHCGRAQLGQNQGNSLTQGGHTLSALVGGAVVTSPSALTKTAPK